MNQCNAPVDIACQVKHLSKRFPGVAALSDINLEIACGEVHGVIGKNGAGKSTFVNILAGLIPISEGEIRIRGKVMGRHYHPRRAEQMGIFLVPQHPLILPGRNVIENLFVGQSLKNKAGLADERRMRSMTEDIIQRLGLSVSPDQDMAALSIDTQKLLLLGKGVYIADATILMLDEITASLNVNERKFLHKVILDIKKSGKSIIFISHHMKEIIQFCDRVTVFRNGNNIITADIGTVSEATLSESIVGTDYAAYKAEITDIKRNEDKPILLSCRDLTRRDAFEAISFDLREGEVIGFAGLMGCGKDLLFRTLFGLEREDSGQVLFKEEELSIPDPGSAIRMGIAYLTDRRESEGLLHGRSIEENLLQLTYRKLRGALWLISRKKTKSAADSYVSDLNIKIASLEAEIDSLSGGNKQKVILARTMSVAPKVYILNEPTQGIDVGTKQEILRSIRESLSKSAGILVSSESIEELMTVCDRIIVLFRGKVFRQFDRHTFDEESIYRAIQGIQSGDSNGSK